ncbi:hypothetical protein C1646_722189 [Rhizophagus diaphanus]|nr:hypothetical protein C1646_722189 [Rhizophagus diaphanus] [Rhizophagus sp. MUCL 43196]
MHHYRFFLWIAFILPPNWRLLLLIHLKIYLIYFSNSCRSCIKKMNQKIWFIDRITKKNVFIRQLHCTCYAKYTFNYMFNSSPS